MTSISDTRHQRLPIQAATHAIALIFAVSLCACEQSVDVTATERAAATTAPDGGPPAQAASTKTSTRQVWNPDGSAEQLTWDDLMPAGEQEKLAQLYEDYYRELERRMLRSQTQLTAPGQAAGMDAIVEGSSMDSMPQLGTFDTVPDLAGLTIRIPAYVVPLEFRSDQTYGEFLLVPYMGACLHTPPPPPNQIIYVRAAKPVRIDDIWAPVMAEGVLSTQRHENDVGTAAYSLDLAKLTLFNSMPD